MKLNHLNLAVPNVPETRAFFEEFFGFHCADEKQNDMLAVMFGEDGFVLVLSNFDRRTAPRYPKAFHVGFILNSREEVNAVNERLQAAGYEVKPPGMMHGSWTFYLNAPGGFLLEVMAQ
jgi:catechol 2,3-dioxygenase-like lactoylglutathione lyase family enzyme